MANKNTKLQIGDVFVINTDDYFGVKGGKYKIIGFGKNRLGGNMYKFQSYRKNATTTHCLHVSDIDPELYIPRLHDLTSKLGIMFLNLKTIVKYDKNLIEEAKKINANN